MIRTKDEQIDYVRVEIGKQLSNLALSNTSDEKYVANENLDFLYGILASLQER